MSQFPVDFLALPCLLLQAGLLKVITALRQSDQVMNTNIKAGNIKKLGFK